MPPRFGKLDVNSWAASAPTIEGYKTDAWVLKQAQILQVSFEVDDLAADNLIPPAMHPVIPAYVTMLVMSCPHSPIGRFAIAETRVMGRAGVRPRGFVLGSFVDSDTARGELASRWGFPVAPGEIHLRALHDRVQASVAAGGKTAFEIEMVDRDFISGADIQYVASMHLARNSEDKRLVLVQVDPEYTFAKAERGAPKIVTFDQELWRAGSHIRFMNPISASFATCDVTLPKIRYVCDPGRPALQGTTKVAA
jgi:Acetoacetate decarboxylase (ADC)